MIFIIMLPKCRAIAIQRQLT